MIPIPLPSGLHTTLARLAVATAIALCAALVPPALGATGDLTPAGCLNAGGTSGCNNGGAALNGADGVAVSPGGDSVYVVSFSGAAISHFRRAANGGLTPAGCLNAGGTNGCSNGGAVLNGADGIAISPQGDSVYVTSASNAITHFRRAANGDLTPAGCLSAGGGNGCNDGGAALGGAAGVAVSPNGKSVYVAGFNSNAISHFVRAANGDLTPAGCLSSGGGKGCNDAGPNVLNNAIGVAISPQGDSVYVASQGGKSIAHFRRAANGDLTGAGCLNADGTSGCNNGGAALDGARGVVVTPGGDSVYVVSISTHSISHYLRAANGDLLPAGCLTSGSVAGCNSAGTGVINAASGVAVSPGADSVYVAAIGNGGGTGNSITHFRREHPAGGGGGGTGGGGGGGAGGGGGTGGGGGGGTGGGTSVAALRSLSITPLAFPAASTGGSALAARRTGGIVSFGLTAPANVRFTVARRAAGRRVGGRCVATKRSNRTKPKCSRYRQLAGSFARSGSSGENRFRFTGRLAGKRLGVGRYRLTARTFAGTVTGTPLSATFRIRR
jgi:DNA-binding beta-propeller fold protein YncE